MAAGSGPGAGLGQEDALFTVGRLDQFEADTGQKAPDDPPVVLMVLSRLFRGLFLRYLEKAFAAGELRIFASLLSLAQRSAFLRHLAPARAVEWVVYAKPPFAGPARVVKKDPAQDFRA